LGAGENANLPNGALTMDRFNEVWLPRSIQQEPVRQAVSGDDFGIIVQFDNTTTFMGLVLGEEEIASLSAVRRAFAGENFAYFELLNGSWLSAGDNDDGELGLGFSGADLVTMPRLVQGLEGLEVRQAALGDEHALFVLTNGSVIGVGDNSDGELGLSNTQDQTVPVRLPVEGVRFAAAAGEDFSLLVLEDGTVLAAGENDDGQLGLGPEAGTQDVRIFTAIPGLPRHVVAAAAGDDFSLFLTYDGYVYGAGENDDGELGIPGTESRAAPVRIPIEIVRQVEAGDDFSVFVLCDGTVFATGANGNGQLGIGSLVDQFEPVQVPYLENVRCADVGPDSEHVYYLMEEASGVSAQEVGGDAQREQEGQEKEEKEEEDEEERRDGTVYSSGVVLHP